MSNMYAHKFHSMLVFNSQCSFKALEIKLFELPLSRVVIEDFCVRRTISKSKILTEESDIKI